MKFGFYLFYFYYFLLQTTFCEDSQQYFQDTERNSDENFLFQNLLQSLKRFDFCTPYQHKSEKLHTKSDNLSTHLSNNFGIHVNQTYFSINYKGQKYVLNLTLNHLLIPHNFSISSYDKDGRMFIHKPSFKEVNHCHYQGKVHGLKDSQVVISTCDGLSGYIALPDGTLLIEPIPTVHKFYSPNKHILYHVEDIKPSKTKATCGSHNFTKEPFDVHRQFQYLSNPVPHRRLKRNANPKFVELLVVADNAEAKAFPDQLKLQARIQKLINFVDGFYVKLNVRTLLSHIEVWNDTNRISDSIIAGTVLKEFVAFSRNRRKDRNSVWSKVDSPQLIFGRDFQGSTVGVAYLQSMCGVNSGGINQDGKSASVFTTAAILAHELGHSLGMEHDSDGCGCPEEHDCLMAPSVGFRPKRTWSDCSERYLEQNLKSTVGSCLVNTPAPGSLFGAPVCGNHVVEDGEECDCGIPLLCRSECCDPKTCKFLPEVKCDQGLCCDNCQFKKLGSVCRPSKGECDLPEFCSGHGPHCPSNVYRLNKSPCLSSTAYCNDGICLTLDYQCKAIWGSTGSVAVDSCFTRINKGGNLVGNCGRDANGQFRRCSEENAKCGMLMCQTDSVSAKPIIGSGRRSYIVSFRVDGKSIMCRTLPSFNSNDVYDDGLVHTGTKCGDDKACFNGRCNATAKHTCDQKCNGRGVCNNLKNCHCNRGWAPPYCKGRGAGGSYDSGPMEPTTDTAVILLVVFCVVLVPLLVFIGIMIWFKFFGGKAQVQMWRENHRKRINAIANNRSNPEVSAVSSNPPRKPPTAPPPVPKSLPGSNRSIPPTRLNPSFGRVNPTYR